MGSLGLSDAQNPVIYTEYPLGVKNDPHIRITARKYNFPKTDQSGSAIERGKIIGRSYFYIPAGIVQNTSSNWNAEDLGAVGALAEGNVLKGLVAAGISLVDGVSSGAISNAKKTLGATKGQMLAPNDVMVLGSVNRYSFMLTAQLAPQNAKEGLEVKKIIENYRKWSQPTMTPNGSKLWMDYPPMFDIFIRPTATSMASASSDEVIEGNNLFFYKDMVIDSFDVNYQGGTNETLFYRDGTPTLVSLRVGFKALRAGMNRN